MPMRQPTAAGGGAVGKMVAPRDAAPASRFPISRRAGPSLPLAAVAGRRPAQVSERAADAAARQERLAVRARPGQRSIRQPARRSSSKATWTRYRHQHGFNNVVATLGTALTERHRSCSGDALRRSSWPSTPMRPARPRPFVVLKWLNAHPPTRWCRSRPEPARADSYQAIRKSQSRCSHCRAAWIRLDLIRRDPPEWVRLVSAAMPVVDFRLNRLAERHDLASAGGNGRRCRNP